MQKPFEEKLLAAGFAPERAEALAITINATLEGALILSRTARESLPLRVVAAEIKTLLQCSTPTA